MSDAVKIFSTMLMMALMVKGEYSSQPVDFDWLDDLQDDLQDKSEEMKEVDSEKLEEVTE